jgi:hypothetical protein
LSVFCNLWPNRAAFTINSPMNYCFNSQLNDCINLFLFPNNCAADSRSSVQPKSCFYTWTHILLDPLGFFLFSII